MRLEKASPYIGEIVMNSKLKNDATDFLFDAILSLENKEECYRFFEDLCTVQELMLFSQRLQVAKHLLAGETYESIRQKIPVSSATITRVNTALQFGKGGYHAALGKKRD